MLLTIRNDQIFSPNIFSPNTHTHTRVQACVRMALAPDLGIRDVQALKATISAGIDLTKADARPADKVWGRLCVGCLLGCGAPRWHASMCLLKPLELPAYLFILAP